MGLIKAFSESVSSTLGDQFLEFVTCPQIEKGTLLQRGQINYGKGNKKPSPGIISNGSAIVVPSGMAMMLVDNGEIAEFSAEPGTYTYDKGTESSFFYGGLAKGIGDAFKTLGKRITYGGQTAKDQRVYYVNLLTIVGNKFGSPQPKKITDEKYGMLEVTFFGEYAFKVEDPLTLVSSVIGANPKDSVTYDEIVGSQLKGKFIEQLTQAISIVMRKHKVSFGDLGMYGSDISNEMNDCLDESWKKEYGLVITDVALFDINLTENSMQRVNTIDDATIFSNPNVQSGLAAKASADAMKTAAGNPNGAMMGFMGMNFAQGQGASVMGAARENLNQNPNGTTNNAAPLPEPGTVFKKEENKVEEKINDAENTSEEKTDEPKKAKFCSECGASVNGKFCSECGTKIND